MGSMQIVLLFDLNSCADFLLMPKEELSKRLLFVRLACLRLLSDFSAKSSSIKWGFKFFDSRGAKTQTMFKFIFSDMSLENFETLENEICVRYERHLSILQALIESSQNNSASVKDKSEKEMCTDLPVNILQLALTQVLCEFQWETMDMWSPSATKIKNRKRNFLFLFSNFKDSDELLFEYFGLNSALSKPKFLNSFLPQSLRDSIVKKAGIHLVLLNMCEDQKFMGSYSSKILPLLSDSLHSIQGSFIPLSVLSQPLYNMQLQSDFERTMYQDKGSIMFNLPSSYHNSFIPFSTLFEQSLDHPFYSTTDSCGSLCKCYINFGNKGLQIPIQYMDISNKQTNLYGDVNMKVTSSAKNKSSESNRSIWSDFIVHGAVSRSVHFPAYKIILCLPYCNESSTSETIDLQTLIKNLTITGMNLLLHCVAVDGLKFPGFLTPLSSDSAVISILDPAVNFLKISSSCNITITSSSKNEDNVDCSSEIQNFDRRKLDLNDTVKYSKNIDNSILKPFKMECLEPWFKPKDVFGITSYMKSKSSNGSLKMNQVWKLLKQSLNIKNDNSSKSKYSMHHLTYEPKSNSVDQSEVAKNKVPEEGLSFESQMNDMEELPSDLSHEELLSAITDVYNSALEPSGNIITASRSILKMMINYCKKHSKACYEEDVNTMFRDNFLMTDKKILEKYEMLDSEEDTEKKIKECQLQIVLIIEVEILRVCPDKSNCENTIIALIRVATISLTTSKKSLKGLEDLETFMQEVLDKNYSHTLYDILGDQLALMFVDSDSASSPAETVSSEFNNEEDLFSSVVSSTLSEKSSSSTGSRKECKDNMDKSKLERKLIRHRSDVSDSSRYRQVLLPKASPKKKKAKIVAAKAVRYSPRLAAKRNEENTKPVSEKPSKVRRNLFNGEKTCRTPKKNGNHASKTKLAAETPSHKQNHSALQRRKSFIDQLSNSPKVIAESPQIRKTARDGTNKEWLEKLQKASQETSKPTNKATKQQSKVQSFKDYTPESKRRLSLKLFSKIMNSPTARYGIKKCTKRLFDQTSPQKTVESPKRHKPNNECILPSNSCTKNSTES